MFDSYVLARQRSLPKWVVPVFGAAVFLHAVALSGAVVHGYWAIEKLPMPKGGVELVVAPPPPPPPPAKKGNRAKPKDTTKKVVTKSAPKEMTQPVKLDKPPEEAPADTDSIGNPEGSDNGVDWSDCVGPTCDENSPLRDAPPPPPPKKEKEPEPQIVPQVQLEAQREAGDPQIRPDAGTQLQMQRDGKMRVTAVFKMCLSRAGGVSSVSMVSSSGYPAYDQKLKAGIRTWRYSPFKVNGQAQPVCSPVTFIYTMK